MEFVGKTVEKEVKDVGIVSGTVKSYDPSSGFMEIVYEDGDSVELESSDVASLVQSGPEVAKVIPRVGRKPKKRRRIGRKYETRGSSVNVSENLVTSMPTDSEFRGISEHALSVSGNSNVNGRLDMENGNGEDLICSTEIMGNVNITASSNGCKETLGNENGLEESSKETISTSGNLKKTDVKDELDLNSRLNLNEDLNLNVECGSLVYSDDSLKRRGCIDLNLDVSNDFDIDLKVADLGCSAVETSKRECNFDLNVEVCDEVKEIEGDAEGDGQSKGVTLFGKMGQILREETDINQKFEDDSFSWNMNDISNGFKLKLNNGSPENTVKDASLSLIEGKEDGNCGGDVAAVDSPGVSNGTSVKDCVLVEVQQKDNPSVAGITITHEYPDGSGSPCKQGNSRRKRRKLSDNLTTSSVTVLRRSSRRASARKQESSNVALHVTEDFLIPPRPSELTEEKPVVSGCKQYEETSVLPPKLQLPSSSQNLNLDDIPVLELFSIYACLRSFSNILFLSPFELEDFVVAMKCSSPCILFDSIHVCILQTLRKHLEHLSNEGCQSALNCLRNLNWDLLDLVTWPVFLIEYLLVHGSGFKSGFYLNHLLRSDYHNQPVSVKVEILQCLCDDMIEAESIRSELNRRSLVTETDMGFDHTMHFDICKKRRAPMDVSGGSCLTEEIVDDTTDWNSDECCLCKMDGSLICCDGCPAAFHSKCVGITSDHLPEGDWYCPECAICRHKPWMKPRRSLRGADLLGIDPHGRLYFNSCGFLLVSDSSDTGSMFNYYHRNDLHAVIEVLKSADTVYSGIIMAINKHWDVPTNLNAGASNLQVLTESATARNNIDIKRECSDMHTSLAPFSSLETCLEKNIVDDQRKLEANSTVGCDMHLGQDFTKSGSQLDSMTTIESPCVASEGSAETTQMRSGIQSLQTFVPFDSNRSDVSLNQSGIPEKQHLVGGCPLTSFSLNSRHDKNLTSVGTICTRSTLSSGNGHVSEMACGIDYINYYSFARTASLVAEELMCKFPEKINENFVLSEEDIISDQAKATMKKSVNFCWPSIQNLSAAAQKEKCGWCFSCKVPNEERDCLFNTVVGPVHKASKSILVGLHPKRNQNGHFRDVISYILSLEDRLCGLLSGPWLNPQHTKLWRKDLLKASDVASVKPLFLTLESNLRLLALSADWLKHVDSVITMGSSSHFVASSLRTSSRHGIGRKRAKCSDTESNSSSNTTGGLGLYWWRGGRLSRHLFNWKVLPRSLVTKAARQAGCKRIPGIFYPENSDFARRSKYVAWRAAVEASKSVEQLAFLVRELDSNIRWHDIENTHPLYVLDKESRKSIRLFKKAIVRRKCAEGESVKYLLDFGKRRAIPNIITRHGSLLDQSSSERKKYWLEESYVPLHLLKNFEEKKIVRKSNEIKPGKSPEICTVDKKLSCERGFSYLFARLERSEYHLCGHCNKDVPIREAVSCMYCKGLFHKRHVKKSGGTITTECTYSCYKCQDRMHAKPDARKRKFDLKLGMNQPQRCEKGPLVRKPAKSQGKKKSLSKGRQVKSQNKKIQSSIPLRRSTRKAKSLYLQSKRNGGRKKGKQGKSKKVTSRKPKETTARRKKLAVTSVHKKRTRVCNSYWVNGLRLSTKPNDERVMLFREKKHLVPSEDSSGTLKHPECRLCCGDGCSSHYIACEICGEWFHGDAFGLTIENTGQLIGFRCHVCRNRAAPICPHMKSTAFSHAESNFATECAEELSNPVSLQPLSEIPCN